MCIEDVHIGRATTSHQGKMVVTTAAKLLTSHSPNRVAILFAPPPSGTLTLATESLGLVTLEGINLTSTSAPCLITLKDHGDLCGRAWFAIMSAGSVNITWWETHFDERLFKKWLQTR